MKMDSLNHEAVRADTPARLGFRAIAMACLTILAIEVASVALRRLSHWPLDDCKPYSGVLVAIIWPLVRLRKRVSDTKQLLPTALLLLLLLSVLASLYRDVRAGATGPSWLTTSDACFATAGLGIWVLRLAPRRHRQKRGRRGIKRLARIAFGAGAKPETSSIGQGEETGTVADGA